MPKVQNNRVRKKNSTDEKLRASPFSEVSQLDDEEKAIRLLVWKRFTEAKIVDELLTKPEFSHVTEELKAGLSCVYKGNAKDQIYKIFSEGQGLKLELNKTFAESMGTDEIKFFQGAVQAGIEGFGAIYFQVKGLLSKPVSTAYSENSANAKIGKMK